ncbi:ABC transporter ATP-binding protein [Marispirochaeta aestuarii]|uniref:ABC transporter ATP-binding protein n=1 Tax=Marispirochaeta aestuarii TaxID=1963862 RepID=UPI002ABD3129|nr:ABC transporter ATP-binding protein [Marispirochaeta aestuarii]
MPGLLIRGLSKSYDLTPAVRDLDLDIREGELTAILGPSGCGKSTLLSCIAGILQPDSGEIMLDDRVLFSAEEGITIPPEKRNMGVVFQSYALWPHMRVAANLAYPLKVRRRPAREIRREVSRILALLKLEDKELRYPGELSGGEQQRVALGRALIMQPDLLLLDEPLSNLDARMRESMQEEIRRIQQTFSLTIIHVTHDQGEAMAMSDRITVMNEGQALQTGSPREIYFAPSSGFVADFVGTNNLIRGKVVHRDGKPLLHLGKGLFLPLPGFQGAEGESLFAVRPEDFILNPGKGTYESGEQITRGRIISSIFRGAHIIYTLGYGESEFRIQAHSDSIYIPGEDVPFIVRKAVRIG